MVYLYDACDQISDFCHQQLLRKMRRKNILDGQKDGRKDRGKTVYPLPLRGAGVYKKKRFCRENPFHKDAYHYYITITVLDIKGAKKGEFQTFKKKIHPILMCI